MLEAASTYKKPETRFLSEFNLTCNSVLVQVQYTALEGSCLYCDFTLVFLFGPVFHLAHMQTFGIYLHF